MTAQLITPKLILIDLDGTLVDSVPDLAWAVDAMMAQLGLPRHGEARVRDWVGNGVERLVKRALTGEMSTDPSAELYARALPLFMDLYHQANGRYSQLFPGVKEGLATLATAGYALGCVTNKAERFTLPLLETLGVLGHFGVIVSGDTTPQKKPSPEPLWYAAGQMHSARERSLMVGDSMHDVQAARAAGFQVVCVSYGYNHGHDIRDARPDAVIDSLTELPPLLREAA